LTPPTPTPPPQIPAHAQLLEILLAAGLVCISAWGLVYAFMGHWPATAVEAGFFAVASASLLWIRRKPEHLSHAVKVNVTAVFLTCTANTIATGGLLESGLFMIWGLIAPMATLVFLGLRRTILVCVALAAIILAMVALPIGSLGGPPLPTAVQPWLAAANILGSGVLCLITLAWFLVRLDRERAAREQSQRQLLESARLESLSTLAGGIAHDFNNVLMALFGNLELAASELPTHSPARARLSKAQEALSHATTLTHQLLSFASGGTPVLSTASIRDTIRDSASFVLTGGKARCVFELSAELWAVEADLGQISRLIQNLAINAAQAMPQGGTITIRADNVISSSVGPRASYGKRFVTIEVQDQGHGISLADRARIFDPFFSTRSGNSGLGLTTCFSIVRDHGGHIDVVSNPGDGACFRIWLPASRHTLDDPETMTSEELACPEDAAGQRVLVMDDEPAVLEVLCDMLESLGYQAIATEEGGEALSTWQQAHDAGQPFHAVILDLTIRGGMGGAQTARELRARQARVPIVASSGYANDQILSNYREHGFDAVLRKPYRMDVLAAALGGILGSNNQG
jgi:signal transduction histidine kinase/CheY-like chemotaxis protein